VRMGIPLTHTNYSQLYHNQPFLSHSARFKNEGSGYCIFFDCTKISVESSSPLRLSILACKYSSLSIPTNTLDTCGCFKANLVAYSGKLRKCVSAIVR